MTASDKRKAQLLVVLLMTASATWYFVYRPGTAPVAQTTKGTTPGKEAAKAIPEAQIRLDLLEDDSAAGVVGRKNIFQYRQKPLPPKPPEPYRPPPPQVVVAPPTQTIIAAPQPPPFKAFRYEGYSSKGGRLIASLSEGTGTYQITEGECLMGQYCVRRLTETVIEIEDLQLKRRQSFPRVQQ